MLVELGARVVPVLPADRREDDHPGAGLLEGTEQVVVVVGLDLADVDDDRYEATDGAHTVAVQRGGTR